MYAKYVKRSIDVVGAVCLLAVAWPFMLIAAIAIKIEDPKGPVLFRQQRPGKDGKIFEIYKFRTMKVETHDKDGNRLPDIERVTKTGNVLRKISLDEFPQFINVLKGDMSFIGPRPLLVQYLEYYNEEQKRRHNVKPGISGWAQVNGRNAITWGERFKLDVWYVDHISLKLDIRILLMTIKNVLARKNINNEQGTTMSYFNEEIEQERLM